MEQIWVAMVNALVPVVVGAIVPSVLAALFASKWWTERTGKAGQIIQAVSTVAVQKVEELYVKPAKEAGGMVKLGPQSAAKAKKLAVEDVVSAVAPLLGPEVERLAPVISQAVEAAVQEMKKELPQRSVDKFPG